MIGELWETIKSLFTRKYTAPVHLALGLLIAFGYVHYPGLAVTLFVLFALVELWQSVAYWYFGYDRKISLAQARVNDHGYTDFWESLVGVSVGLVILLILRAFGVYV
jgi:hypothetical protein